MIDATTFFSMLFILVTLPFSVFAFRRMIRSYRAVRHRHWLLRFTIGITIAVTVLLFIISVLMTIIIYDIGRFNIRSPHETQRMLVMNTNPLLLHGLSTVDLRSPPVFYESLFFRFAHAAGKYNAVTRNIVLRDLLLPNGIAIWWHELGHHIWYYHMLPEEREEFDLLHLHDVRILRRGNYSMEVFGTTGFSTLYSVQSAEEDFADSYAAFMSHTWMRRTSWVNETGAARVSLIEDVIRRVTRCDLPDARECSLSPEAREMYIPIIAENTSTEEVACLFG